MPRILKEMTFIDSILSFWNTSVLPFFQKWNEWLAPYEKQYKVAQFGQAAILLLVVWLVFFLINKSNHLFHKLRYIRGVVNYMMVALKLGVLYVYFVAISSFVEWQYWPQAFPYIRIILINGYIMYLYANFHLWIRKNRNYVIRRIQQSPLNFIKYVSLRPFVRQLGVFSVSFVQFFVIAGLVLAYTNFAESYFSELKTLQVTARTPGVLLILFVVFFREILNSIYSSIVYAMQSLALRVCRDIYLRRVIVIKSSQIRFIVNYFFIGLSKTFGAFLFFLIAKKSVSLLFLAQIPPVILKLFEIGLYVGIVYFLWQFYKWFHAVWKTQKQHIKRYSRLLKFYLFIDRTSPFNAVRVDPFIATALKTIHIVIVGTTAYLAFGVLLRILPVTRKLSTILFGQILSPISAGVSAVINFLPNLFIILFVIILTNYVMDFTKFFFKEVEQGHIKFDNFLPEFAIPTYKIVRFLILIFAIVIVFPYLPGSQSPAFKGITVFLGVLFSLGSSSVVANLMAGILITYMRPFKIGDRVKISDTVGDVVEKTLLVTRIKTIKNVFVAIPNSLILNAHITNFSFSTHQVPVILHTKVTIGYDVPWKTVKALLIAAASKTEHIIAEPQPFVLQTALNDFYVEYEINAYTTKVDKMAVIYSEIHQHIQDEFAKAGVEIMSPSYHVARLNNDSTIPPAE